MYTTVASVALYRPPHETHVRFYYRLCRRRRLQHHAQLAVTSGYDIFIFHDTWRV